MKQEKLEKQIQKLFFEGKNKLLAYLNRKKKCKYSKSEIKLGNNYKYYKENQRSISYKYIPK